MMNFIKKVAGMISAVAGSGFMIILMYNIVTDELWITSRVEGAIAMTAIPLMMFGFQTLKDVWTAEALSKRDKKLRAIESASEEEAA